METQPWDDQVGSTFSDSGKADVNGVKDGEIERPKVLDGMTPISPTEQRENLPKRKRNPKAKAAPEAKTKSKKGKGTKRKGLEGEESKEVLEKDEVKDNDEKKVKSGRTRKTKASSSKDGEAVPENPPSNIPADSTPPAPHPSKRLRRKSSVVMENDKSGEAKQTSTATSESRGQKRKVDGASASTSGGVAANDAGENGEGGEGDANGEQDRKRRISRKSAAYHRARKAALTSGKSPDEAKALAKQVL